MICKNCQAELPENARFCPECGALQPMICPECGAESRPGSKVCSGCGKKLPMPEREDRLVYTKKKRYPMQTAATVALVLAAILLLAAAVLFLTRTLDFSRQEPEHSTQEPAPEQSTEPEELPVEAPPAQPDEPTGDELPAEPEAPTEEEIPAEPEAPTEEEIPAEPDEPADEEPETEPEVEPETEPAETGYIFPDSSERLLTEADVQGLSSWELKIARNEIYARHGRRFNSQELQDYFDSRDWYHGTIDPAGFTDEMLSDIELANVQLLKAAE